MHTDSTKKQTRAGVLPMKPIKSSARIHPVSQECLQRLCDDPTTTLCIFSGSERNRLSQAFAHLPKLWIAAENGCFIRPPLEGKDSQLDSTGAGKWITMVETANLDWLESVQLVFDYFCERTPRSFVETRETSLVRAMWSIQRRIRWSSVLQSCQLLVLFTYRLEPTREHRTLSPMLMLW